MPSSSKSPQASSTKPHSFLRKSTEESPSFKTTSTSMPSEVRTPWGKQPWDSSFLVRISPNLPFESLLEKVIENPSWLLILKSRYSIFVVPLFSQLGNISIFCVSGVFSPSICRHRKSQPGKFSGIVFIEVGSLLKVIWNGATSRHLSDTADIFPTASQQPGFSATLPSSSYIFSL